MQHRCRHPLFVVSGRAKHTRQPALTMCMEAVRKPPASSHGRCEKAVLWIETCACTCERKLVPCAGPPHGLALWLLQSRLPCFDQPGMNAGCHALLKYCCIVLLLWSLTGRAVLSCCCLVSCSPAALLPNFDNTWYAWGWGYAGKPTSITVKDYFARGGPSRAL